MIRDMKKIQYIFVSLLLTFLAIGCKKGNDNWVIVEEVQPGVYVTGEATIFSGEAPASQLKQLNDMLDPGDTPVPAEVTFIDTWLKAGSTFQITIATDKDNVAKYGAGEELPSTTKATKIYALSKDASFQVAEDGLYRILVNSALQQAHIIRLDWGVIGAASAGGWDAETPFATASFDEATYTAVLQGKTTFSVGEFKFRFGGDWGYDFALDDATTLKFHSNIGIPEAGTIDYKGAFLKGKFGGDNLAVPHAGEYEVTIKYNLRSREYQVAAKLLGEPTPPPAVTLPETLFIIGTINEWNWDKAFELIPVNGNGEGGISRFWKMQYFKEGDQVKFNYTREQNGKEYGFDTVADTSKEFAGISDEGGNINIGKAGWYLVLATVSINADGSALVNKVEFLAPNVYLVGDAANGEWSTPNNALFTIPTTEDGEFVSPAVAKDADLRIAIAVEGADWWKTEFIARDGKIEYRGTGGDQEPRVPIKAGQKVYLNFGDNTGSIK